MTDRNDVRNRKANNPLEKIVATALFLFALFLLCTPAQAQSEPALSKGETVYVPVYSHIYAGDAARPFYLTVTLSVRNTDQKNQLTLLAVDYYDSDGKLLERYLKNPITLKPLATSRFLVKESEKAGGSGANFIVKWKSDEKINAPLIESVMISTRGQQGISFTSRGQVIK